MLKSICQSKKLSDLKTDGARLLYTWLLPNVDINGCFSGDEYVINGQILSRLRKTIAEISGYMQDLHDVGLIIWYEAEGDKFLYIPDFVERQPSLNPKREAKSNIPLPTADQLRSNSNITPPKVKQSKVKVKQSKGKFSSDSDEFRLANYLFKHIQRRKQDFKEPNLQSWAKHVDLMIRIDKREPESIKRVIAWCQSDGPSGDWNGWQNNILSTAKLRKQFDRLEMQSDNRKTTQSGKREPKEEEASGSAYGISCSNE